MFHPKAGLALATLLIPVLLVLCVSVGSVPISPVAGFAALSGGGDGTVGVILGIRLIRCLLALTVGAGLAVAGCAYQGMFGNPLADPFVIGSSSGAALGAVLSLSFSGTAFFLSVPGVGASAFTGSAAAVALSYAVSRSFRGPRTATTLLLAGTAVSSLFSAATTLILTLNDRQLHPAFYWIMGGFSGSDLSDLAWSFPSIAAGTLLLCLCARMLDVLAQGDEESFALGLRPERARLLVGTIATFIVAQSVSVSGTIGFIGLVSPHIARKFTGPAHRFSLPLSALAGGVLLLLSDTAARTLFSPIEIPVGAITALIGAPFFLFLLAKGNARGGVK